MGLQISVLASGSSGNSIVINNKKNTILIDAGLSGKELIKRLNKCGLNDNQPDAILITHEHSDHIKGAGILSRRLDIPVYANQRTWGKMENSVGKIDEKNCCIFKNNFMIGNLGIIPFNISHDAVDPVGFVINCKNKNIGIATDMGHVPSETKKKLKGLDFFVFEANHDLEMLRNGSYPYHLKKRIRSDLGHLSNDDTAHILPDLITDNYPKILLAHLSQENNNPQVAYLTIKNKLEAEGYKIDENVEMDFTFKEKATKLYKV